MVPRPAEVRLGPDQDSTRGVDGVAGLTTGALGPGYTETRRGDNRSHLDPTPVREEYRLSGVE